MFLHTSSFRVYDLVEGIACSALVLFFLSHPLSAQQTVKPFEEQYPFFHRTPQFESVGEEQGLSSSYCRGPLLVDSRGFLWVGTIDGLNRYDGYKFHIYRHDVNDSSSISGSAIRFLFEDRNRVIWVGTFGSGLSEYSPSTNSFIQYMHDPDDSTSISNNIIQSLFQDRKGNLWIGTDDGVNKLVATKSPSSLKERWKFKRYYLQPRSSLSKDVIGSIGETKEGLLVLRSGRATYSFDPSTEQFTKLAFDPRIPKSFQGKTVRYLTEDHVGLWFKSDSGICYFERESNQFVKVGKNSKFRSAIDSSLIMQIHTVGNGSTWFATMSGLFEFRSKTDRILLHEDSRGTVSIAEDSAHNLWFATNGGGLRKLNKRAREFKTFGPTILTRFFLLERPVGTLITVADTLLIAIDSSSERQLTPLGNLGVQDGDYDSSGGLWLWCTNGVARYDGPTRRLAFYGLTKRNYDAAYTMLASRIDNKGCIWVGTRDMGLFKFDLRTKRFIAQFRRSTQNPNSISDDRVFSIEQDDRNHLWLGLDFGLNRFNTTTEMFELFGTEQRDSNSVAGDEIGQLLNDGKSLWLGTNNGLKLFDKSLGNVKGRFRRGSHLSNYVSGLIKDRNGTLWIMYMRDGIARFDTQTGTLTTFSKKDGLPTDRIHLGYLRENGEVVLLSNDGALITFHPDSIRPSTFIPNIVLTSFSVFDKSINLLEDSFSYKPITLPHDSNFVTFEFASLDLTVPERNQHAYKLEGYEDNWNYVGNRREAHYTKVPPGEYVFRVKGTNSDGVWNEKGTFVNITITPPWWKTTWAYLGYALIAGFVFYSARRYDLNRVGLKHDLELKDVEARKLQEVGEMKSRFFANISHEFRTPLTLILGPIQKWRRSLNPEERSDEGSRGQMNDEILRRHPASRASAQDLGTDLGMMERNAQRLLRLINQLLDLSKLEAGGMKLQASKQNIVPFVKGIAQSFESSAGRRGIALTIEAESENIEAYFDRDKLEKILVNLLSNAFKFTGEGGSVSVSIGLRRDVLRKESFGQLNVPTEVFAISVADTGIGIPQDQLDKVFNRFYQVDASQTREQEGSGIGLALTKELVELHHGSISVQSEVGKGTTFVVTLRLGREHLKDDETVETLDIERRMGEGAKGREGDRPLSDSPTLPVSPSVTDDGQLHTEPAGQTAPLVLIIEDNADVRAYIKEYLVPTYLFEEARDGAQGIAKAKELIPDLIISDVMMPKMDGYEVCKQLKRDEKTSHIPIILLTAKAGQENKLEGLETGADDYLTKPFDAQELLARMKNLIEVRRKLREKFEKGKVLKPGEIAVTSMDDQFLQKVMAIVEKKIGDEKFRVEEFAEEVSMSRSQLHRKLTALTNQSPSDFIRYMRLHRAKQLLEQNAGNVSEIAFQVGFNSVAYFSKCFREQFGVVPSEVARS